jgi:lysophospholipid acyltransferase (LPLAT)-like uncharacterized protein
VLPFHLEASRYWTMASWDRTQIPKPFATVGMAMGAPILVEADADDVSIESARLQLEAELRRLETRALTLVRR